MAVVEDIVLVGIGFIPGILLYLYFIIILKGLMAASDLVLISIGLGVELLFFFSHVSLKVLYVIR